MTGIGITVHGSFVGVSRRRAGRNVSDKAEDTRAVRGETGDRAGGGGARRTTIPRGARILRERSKSHRKARGRASGQRIGKAGIGRRVRSEIRYGYGKGQIRIGMNLRRAAFG